MRNDLVDLPALWMERRRNDPNAADSSALPLSEAIPSSPMDACSMGAMVPEENSGRRVNSLMKQPDLTSDTSPGPRGERRAARRFGDNAR